jgi:catechol 2,3-dioxygenase-like lactoylglutathione lyase family enzyme
MKLRLVVAVLAFVINFNCFPQNTSVDVSPYFSAVIVSNIEASSAWYQSVFDLKVKNKIDDPNYGAKVIILESSKILIELLELKSAIAPKTLLEGKTKDAKVQGHFKIGFKVSNMDEWLKRLSTLKITVDRVYTDSDTKKRNFLITDPDGNLVQFFE